MFQFDKSDDKITIHISGGHKEAIQEMADILELNETWPIFPIALENLYKMCRVHKDTEEKLRDIIMLNAEETEGMFLLDIEQVKMNAKKMELSGIEDDIE